MLINLYGYINRLRKFTPLLVTILVMVGLEKPASAQACPSLGWQENLSNFQKPSAQFPTEDTKVIPTPDCNFHQWSAEAFVWGTALDTNGVPRFLSLATPDQLLNGSAGGKSTHLRKPLKLRLGARALGESPSGHEGAGAIVEADGGMLVGPNGYPVYASVHMNDAYFKTAKSNMVKNGGYQKNVGYFPIGSAVFKATWLRLDKGQAPPLGAFVTKAEVPVLSVLATKQNAAVVPSGKTVLVDVALVGLHVVGETVNHPEFLWATFEHNLNAPRVADNTMPLDTDSKPGSNAGAFTFYSANTPYFGYAKFPTTPSANQYVNVSQPQTVPPSTAEIIVKLAVPQLSFNVTTQKFSPIANVVQENATGGENQDNGQGSKNVTNISQSLSAFFNSKAQSPAQSQFANYVLNGTVWFMPNSYVDSNPQALQLDQSNAVGSVNLSNTTAETFQQIARNTNMANVQNCFLCHNGQTPTSSTSTFGTLTLKSRRIAISHVLEEGTSFAVPNLVTIPLGAIGK